MVNALHHGERDIRKLAVSAAPCGHCRQFYSELACAVRGCRVPKPAFKTGQPPAFANQHILLVPTATAVGVGITE